MPIHEYTCGQCGANFEALIRPAAKTRVQCTRCGGRKVTRRLSVFGAKTAGAGGGGCAGCKAKSCKGCGKG